MESTETTICRLCFSSKIRLIDIFDNADSNIVEVINEHIGEVTDTFTSYKSHLNRNQFKKIRQTLSR